jgi:hypothetical protein
MEGFVMAGVDVALGIGTKDPSVYLDKQGERLEHGDFIRWNPDDDDWLDVVVEIGHTGKLTTVYELGGGELKLKDWLLGSRNPVLKVGNINSSTIDVIDFE